MTNKEILKELSTFETSQCGMYDENILMDPETHLPVKNITSSEHQNLRVKLCPVEIRSKRLGCAHSISNKRFMDLVNRLDFNNEAIEMFKS